MEPIGISKHPKVFLPDDIKQQKKQQPELVIVIARIDGKVSSLKTLFDWPNSTFSQFVQTLFIRDYGYFEIDFKRKNISLSAFHITK